MGVTTGQSGLGRAEKGAVVGDAAESTEVSSIAARGLAASRLSIETKAELVFAIWEEPSPGSIPLDEDIGPVFLGGGLAIIGPMTGFTTRKALLRALSFGVFRSAFALTSSLKGLLRGIQVTGRALGMTS
jgi:hypothetical protein